MKKLVLLLLCSATAFAVTAKHTPTTVPQPDGTTVTVIGFGDERYNYTETLDGYVVVQAPDRFYYYAQLDAAGRFTPGPLRVASTSAAQMSAAQLNVPKHLRETPAAIAERVNINAIERTISERAAVLQSVQTKARTKATTLHVLILCVQYSNLLATQTAASFQDMVNDDSYNGGIGGMSAYYKEISYGAVSVAADVQNWVTAAQPSSYYAYSNANYGTHVAELIDGALDAAQANGVDFSTYDNDGDGTVDGLFIVHAGPGAEEGGQTQYIWSHSSSLTTAYQRTFDGVTISPYIIMPELYATHHVEIGVFCHEFGHALGLPDLYDTNGSTNGSAEGLGNWCLMASGSWGADGNSPERPAHMSAYAKEQLGFVTPVLVQASTSLSIGQAETNSQSYKIWLDESQGDEYVLIENRQKTGFDLNMPSGGLLVYHVDKNLADIWPGSNAINVKSSHLGVKLYEADGLENLANGNNRGDAGDPYPGSSGNTLLNGTSTPNTHLWSGAASGLQISGITAPGSVMSANVTVPAINGNTLQFYRWYTGWGYGSASSTGYGMIACVPPVSGQLTGIRVFSYANRYSTISAQCYQTFSGGALSSPVGSTVTVTSDAVTDFVKLTFSPAINVSEGVPVYVRIYFQRASTGGYVVPIDITGPATGNSYYSSNGATFSQFTAYDIPARAIFKSTSLPVQLASFTARPADGGVALAWATVSEINNFGFEVQKDTLRTVQSFATIPGSFVAGNGTTLTPHSYTFTDPHAAPGTWVYRLRQTDLDGTEAFSEPVIVQNVATAVDAAGSMPTVIALDQNYPNPFNPATVIPYALPQAGQVRITVYDMLGREMGVLVNGHQEAGYHTVRFDASDLSSGAYFARMTSGSFVKTVRLMLVR